MTDLDNFRTEVRDWLAENCPVSLRNSQAAIDDAQFTRKNRSGDSLLWLELMAEKGWTAPTWPQQYGGAGLSQQQSNILSQEMAAIKAPPPLLGMGMTMIGPTILEMGNDDQRTRHLSLIATGNMHWCQGYSEPNAGSDLANLQTKATDNGDHYLVNGSKIWTSGAMYADWMFCLVRTDSVVKPKQAGISFVLFPMTDPGVSIKPIRLISGASPFCQVFFDDVKALKIDRIGEESRGWTVGKRLLQYERSSIGTKGRDRFGVRASPADMAKKYRSDENGRTDDPLLRHQIAKHEMKNHAFTLTTQRLDAESLAGKTPGFATSMLKVCGSELIRERNELLVSIMGPRALGLEDTENFSEEEQKVTNVWLFSKALTIAGGCSEVQLDIISKRILELPTS